MSDWIAGLISGIAGGGKEMARQAETTLDEISKSRLRAFDLNEDRQTRAADWTNRKMESLEERTSREKENQAQREFQGKHNDAVLALQRQQLEQQAGHNAASLALQQQQLEFQRKGQWSAPIEGEDGTFQYNPVTGEFRETMATTQSEQAKMLAEQGMTEELPSGMLSATTQKPFKAKQAKGEVLKALTEQLSAATSIHNKAETEEEKKSALLRMNVISAKIDKLFAPVTEESSATGSAITKPNPDGSMPTAGSTQPTATTPASQITQMRNEARAQAKTAEQQVTVNRFKSTFESRLNSAKSEPILTRKLEQMQGLFETATRLGLAEQANAVQPLLQQIMNESAAKPDTSYGEIY